LNFQIDDRSIVSCSGDGIVLYTQLTSQPFTDPNMANSGAANLNYFNCHSTGTTYEVLTIPTESNSFMSCGEDGTVRLFDLRKISRYVWCQGTYHSVQIHSLFVADVRKCVVRITS